MSRLQWNNPISVTLLFYLTVQMLDLLTSYIAGQMPGVTETNPFMRDELHRFVLLKGIFVKAAITAGLGICSIVLLMVLRFWDERKAAVIACLPFILSGVDVFLNAAMNNFFVILGLAQP